MGKSANFRRKKTSQMMTTTIDRLIKIKKRRKKIFIKYLQLLARSRIDAAASFRLVNASTISFGDIVSPYTDSRS